jgi:hypothetical protein
MPEQALSVPRGGGPQNFYAIRTQRWQICQPYTSAAINPPGDIPGRSQELSVVESIKSMKNSNIPTGNRTRNFPT